MPGGVRRDRHCRHRVFQHVFVLDLDVFAFGFIDAEGGDQPLVPLPPPVPLPNRLAVRSCKNVGGVFGLLVDQGDTFGRQVYFTPAAGGLGVIVGHSAGYLHPRIFDVDKIGADTGPFEAEDFRDAATGFPINERQVFVA